MKTYLICGKARHGKDTLASYMKKYYEALGKKVTILQLAAPLKALIKNHFGWDGREETKPRELLQHLGTDIIRVELAKDDYFIRRCCEDAIILGNFFDVIIISDGRFPIEIEYLKANLDNFVSIHIERPSLVSELKVAEQKHISETALDNYDKFDYKVINTTFESLENQAKEIIRKEEVKDEKNDK